MKIPDSYFDAALGLYAVFVCIPRRESILLKLVLESYEGLAVVRSVEPDGGGLGAEHVLLVVCDAVADVERVLASVDYEVPAELMTPTPAMRDDLRAQLLGELDR